MATTQEKISSTAPLAPGDLPDPLDLPAKSPASGDADEIISQLAANQIDKMLADANVEPPGPLGSQDETRHADETSLGEPEDTQAQVDPVESETILSDDVNVETTAEEFSKILSDEPSTFNQTAPIAPPIEQAMADVQSAAEELARELEADRLETPARHVKSESASADHEPKPAVSLRVGFNVLSAINAPVKDLSDNTRELIGSIAIITLVNAMSILLYLMIYR